MRWLTNKIRKGNAEWIRVTNALPLLSTPLAFAISQAVEREKQQETAMRSHGTKSSNEGISEDGRVIVRRVGSYKTGRES